MLDSLRIKNFRCFEDLEIESLGRVNLIVGKNNVGKSTLLEAIFILARNGAGNALRQILEARHETFSYGELFDKIRHSDSVEEIYIGSDDRSLSKPNKNYSPYVNYDESRHRFHAFDGRPGVLPISTIETQLESEDKLARSWDDAYLNSEEKVIINTLKILNQKITNLIFIQSRFEESKNNNSERIAILKIDGKAEATPLKAMGEGMSRLLNIFLKATQARDGFLTIDEFENGLHYSIQDEVWNKLFQFAKELNIQVFATTHSQDAIKSFSKVALKSPEEGRLISLGRNAREIDNGKITAITYNEDEIKLIAETGMEVR